MSNPLANWWRSHQFSTALKQGNTRLAERLLRESQNSGARLSWVEQLFKNKLQSEKELHERKTEAVALSQQLSQAFNTIEELQQKLEFYRPDDFKLNPNSEFIQFVSNQFKLIEHDENKLQCTGIDERIFEDFEVCLVKYLKEEFTKFNSERLSLSLQEAIEDINGLKRGQDPDYRFYFTPHVYFMRYFLEKVYCNYLAWFLIYKDGLLSKNVNILDIGAGPGTVAYGLPLLLQSSSGFSMPRMHLSYYSLEKQAAFQYRGLQFWRQYIEPQQTATNAYFRFDTSDIFTWEQRKSKLPREFFDFIVISHCFFSEPVKRIQSHSTYKQIFHKILKPNGYVLLILQDKKLFKIYDVHQTEDHEQEKKLVEKFVAELGLQLVWYKYLTSTGTRKPCSATEFRKFALQNLPKQLHMSPLMQQYLDLKYESHYTLDDYVVLAKKLYSSPK